MTSYNYVQSGQFVSVPAPDDLSAGDLVVIGALIGVAITDAASGDDVALAMSGVFTLPQGGTEFSVGDYVYYDGSECTDDDTDTLIGVCVKDAADTETTVDVRLMVGGQGAVGPEGPEGPAGGG